MRERIMNDIFDSPHTVVKIESGFNRFYCDDGNTPFSFVADWLFCPYCGERLIPDES